MLSTSEVNASRTALICDANAILKDMLNITDLTEVYRPLGGCLLPLLDTLPSFILETWDDSVWRSAKMPAESLSGSLWKSAEQILAYGHPDNEVCDALASWLHNRWDIKFAYVQPLALVLLSIWQYPGVAVNPRLAHRTIQARQLVQIRTVAGDASNKRALRRPR